MPNLDLASFWLFLSVCVVCIHLSNVSESNTPKDAVAQRIKACNTLADRYVAKCVFNVHREIEGVDKDKYTVIN